MVLYLVWIINKYYIYILFVDNIKNNILLLPVYAAYIKAPILKSTTNIPTNLCTNNYCEEEKKKINKLKKSLLIRIYNRHINTSARSSSGRDFFAT